MIITLCTAMALPANAAFCKDCSGVGYKACFVCSGTGTKPDSSPCTAGTFNGSYWQTTCNTCDGTGNDPHDWVPCLGGGSHDHGVFSGGPVPPHHKCVAHGEGGEHHLPCEDTTGDGLCDDCGQDMSCTHPDGAWACCDEVPDCTNPEHAGLDTYHHFCALCEENAENCVDADHDGICDKCTLVMSRNGATTNPADKLPPMGDNGNIIFWVLLGGAAVTGLGFTVKRKKKYAVN